MNYFELFGMPVSPVVNRAELAKKYFELQKQHHPDYFTKSGEDEQEQSLELSASINKAFNIFQSEEKTLEYFLQVSGVLEADEKYNLPPDFLMEMMDLNEMLPELPEQETRARIQAYSNQLANGIKPYLQYSQTGSNAGQATEKLKEYYYKKKYLKRILDRLPD